jgi:hypothetical protein
VVLGDGRDERVEGLVAMDSSLVNCELGSRRMKDGLV